MTCADVFDQDVRLIENNAHVGARVACEIAKLEHEQRDPHASSATYIPSILPSQQSTESQWSATLSAKAERVLPTPSVLIFGSAAIDVTSSSSLSLSPKSTTPGSIFVSPGGVGRNIAEAAQNLLPTHSVQVVSIVGRQPSSFAVDEPDAFGKLLKIEMDQSGLRTDGLVISREEHLSTAACSLTLDKDGDLVAGVADMGIVESMTAGMVIRLRQMSC